MNRSPRTPLRVVIVAFAMLLGMVVIAPSQADAHGDSPCPHFSIHDVFADPDGDWDHDRASNAVELYNGLKPCVPDATTFCTNNPTLCSAPVNTVVHNCASGYWSWAAVNANPNGDWDGDGVSNYHEARNGANPCVKPCPYPRHVDVSLNPNGDWDYDGTSNAVEVWNGTNPCTAYITNPCPHWTAAHVHNHPNGDWDRDGFSNRTELYNGTNPCTANVVIVVPTHVPDRLPHVGGPTHQPPGVVPAPTPTCPPGYPYYHPANGKCYANPIRPF